MPHATVNSLRLFYDIHGSGDFHGPAIVLLHGLGSSGDDWPLQVAAFALKHRVITVDARGHGKSDRPSGACSIPQMAGDVAGLLAQFDEPPAHVVGLSLGGCMALQLALDYPDRVRSLVLVNAFAKLQPAARIAFTRYLKRLWLLAFAPMTAVAEQVAGGLFPKPEQRGFYEMAVARLSANPKATYWESVRALMAFDVRRRLGEIRCPTLIIAGDRDTTVPFAAKELLQRGIPGARLAVVADSGHATPYDQAEEFNRQLTEFWRLCDPLPPGL